MEIFVLWSPEEQKLLSAVESRKSAGWSIWPAVVRNMAYFEPRIWGFCPLKTWRFKNHKDSQFSVRKLQYNHYYFMHISIIQIIE